jgi:hypothetical protein
MQAMYRAVTGDDVNSWASMWRPHAMQWMCRLAAEAAFGSSALRSRRVSRFVFFVMVHQSTIAPPQVNPEPNATMATFMPRWSLPLRSASAIRIGIVAAVVLP